MKNRKQINMAQPAERMLVILNTDTGLPWHQLLNYMTLGSHVENPYHNTVHELQVAFHSLAAFTYDDMDSLTNAYGRSTRVCLTIAALMHDHSHSGGRLDDEKNIRRALRAVDSQCFAAILTELGVLYSDYIGKLIACTQFDKQTMSFPNEPFDNASRCLRDADLCSMFSDEGRQLLVGLAAEIYRCPVEELTRKQRADFYKGQLSFIKSATMYTTYGNIMRDDHMDSAFYYLHKALKLDGPYSIVSVDGTDNERALAELVIPSPQE